MNRTNGRKPDNGQEKDQQLEHFRVDDDDQFLTTNQGVRVNHTDDSLKAGERGPTLMEDFHFREKMTHFDHERIPERVVHARGSAAHGYFQVYEPMAEYTKAAFLQNPSQQTPVFVRFSTVVGFRGSADTIRDVRGFATKFYTEEGNFDLVGNNMPVFFIQDAIKFPDLVHAIKPEPHNEMPQASAAHDNFWDFVSLTPETLHHVLWVLSDRALPRSYRMMEGFGVHTFRLINDQGKSRFVKFHWKPLLGTHSRVWDEMQKIAGKDPDADRRDLWETIDQGGVVEFELGFQIVEEEDEFRFDFDLLDPTKFIPEEEVPVMRVGKMTLNRNPDNFFAETEQVAFHPGHVVPGIDFTNDPLLQGRLFSYTDTQLIRLGGPNFHEIPINRAVCPFHNNQRDGYMRQTINTGRTNYYPNSTRDGYPAPASAEEGGYVHYAEKVEGHKVRQRSESFKDFYTQCTLFWNSQSDAEKQHLIEATHFELGKVMAMSIRERMVEHFNKIDHELAKHVAMGIGVAPPIKPAVENHGRKSPALSLENTVKGDIKTRKVGILVADGVAGAEVAAMQSALMQEGAVPEVIAKSQSTVKGTDGSNVTVDKSFVTTASVLYDALYVPGGARSIEALRQNGNAVHFINEAFKHCKPLAASNEGVDLLAHADLNGIELAGNRNNLTNSLGVVTLRGSVKELIPAFVQAIGEHRHWARAQKEAVPA